MSETQTRSRLRQLAFDYANGRISRSSYIRARTQFLDALTRHSLPAEEITVPRAMSPDGPPASEPTAEAPRKSNAPVMLGGAAVGVAALLALAVLLMPSSQDSGRTAPAATQEARPRSDEPAVAAVTAAPPESAPPSPTPAEPPAPATADLLGDPRQEAFWAKEEPNRRARVPPDEAPGSSPVSAAEPPPRPSLSEAAPAAQGGETPGVPGNIDTPPGPQTTEATAARADGSGDAAPAQPSPEPAVAPTQPDLDATAVPAALGSGATERDQPATDTPPQDAENEPKAAAEAPVATGRDSCVPRNPKRLHRCVDKLNGGGRGPMLIVLPGGRFIQGGDQAPSERPAHPVTISRPFAIAIYEISNEEYRRFCQTSGRPCPPNRWPDQQGSPAVDVSWDDAVAYTRWLSEQTGRTYRLPTESEWEYAARDGTTGAYPVEPNFLDNYAHFSERERQDRPVGRHGSDRSLKKNASRRFGLFHMLGNAREWVMDAWHAGYQGAPRDGSARRSPDTGQRVVRGGSYADGLQALRTSVREGVPRGHSDARTGFRVVREIGTPTSSSSLIEMGNWWLAQQPDGQYRLQVFALERLDAPERLLKRDPTPALKVVRVDKLKPPLRVLWGAYDSPQEAKRAAGSLPPTLAEGAGTPIPKRIAELR